MYQGRAISSGDGEEEVLVLAVGMPTSPRAAVIGLIRTASSAQKLPCGDRGESL